MKGPNEDKGLTTDVAVKLVAPVGGPERGLGVAAAIVTVATEGCEATGLNKEPEVSVVDILSIGNKNSMQS